MDSFAIYNVFYDHIWMQNGDARVVQHAVWHNVANIKNGSECVSLHPAQPKCVSLLMKN